MEQLSTKRDLPEGILEQIILPRLPPKSLGQFMCVSKSWRAQGEMSCFGPSHRYDLVSLVVGDDDDDLVSNVISLPLGGMWTRCREHLEIAGHCDGIICLRLCLGNLVLCNPTIKDFKLVPKSCLLLPEEESVTHSHIMSCRELLGFGYNPKGKYYKVIRCVQRFHDDGHWLNAEVYTIGTNSWRQISCYDPSPVISQTSTQQLFFNGIYYWHLPISCMSHCILSFNMGDETSIALVTPWLERSCGNYVNYDKWLLNDNSCSCVWTKHLTITTKQLVEETLYGPIRHVPLVVLWRSDQLVTAEEDRRVVVSYDLAGNKEEQGTKSFKYYLPMDSTQPKYSYHQAVLYVNSLVPVIGGHKLEDIQV